MDLILGGFAQGKTTFVQKNFPDFPVWDDFEQFVKLSLSEGSTPGDVLKAMLKKIENSPEIKIIVQELGSGIVPMEKSDREWREVTGRLTCELAARAEKVFRITAGIAVRIK